MCGLDSWCLRVFHFQWWCCFDSWFVHVFQRSIMSWGPMQDTQETKLRYTWPLPQCLLHTCSTLLFCYISYFMLNTVILLYFIFHALHCYSVVFHISCSALLFCYILYFMLITVILLYFNFHWYSVLCWAVTSVSVTSIGCLPTRHALGVTTI